MHLAPLSATTFRAGWAALCENLADEDLDHAIGAAYGKLIADDLWDGLPGTLGAFAAMEVEARLETAERMIRRIEATPRPRRRTKQVVHGTPITPLSALQRLSPTSFCLTYYNRRPPQPYIERLAEDGLLILDNGAYPLWRENLRRAQVGLPPIVADEAYWAAFYAWAWAIMLREPRAVLIIPDVIDGTLEDNRRLMLSVPPEIPHDRCLPVWHLHEPISHLLWIVRCWGHVAFGSSGPYANPGSDAWRARVAEAFEAIERLVRDPAEGQCWPRIHMLRGLAPMQDAEFPFTSADSTNLARNHAKRHKALGALERFQARLEALSYPDPPLAPWPLHSGLWFVPRKSARLARPLQLDLLMSTVALPATLCEARIA